jgi:hypothetical protein
MREALLLLLLMLAVLLVVLLVMPLTHLIVLKLHVRTATSVGSCRPSKGSLLMRWTQGFNCFDVQCGGGGAVSRALWTQLQSYHEQQLLCICTSYVCFSRVTCMAAFVRGACVDCSRFSWYEN